MSDITRRDMLGLLAAVPLAGTLGSETLERATRFAQQALAAQANGQQYTPRFFTQDEWRTVRVLVDIVIPRDQRSGSATDAGVPEFMDFTLYDRPTMQAGMRNGLAWLDAECRRRFSRTFIECDTSQRTAVLDDIAWPSHARADMAEGVRFFTQFRDMTASGFWSSRIGVEDLRYMGNTVNPNWQGCSQPALDKLGVSYEEWDRKYGV